MIHQRYFFIFSVDLSQKKDPLNVVNIWSYDRGEWSHNHVPGRECHQKENYHMTKENGLMTFHEKETTWPPGEVMATCHIVNGH